MDKAYNPKSVEDRIYKFWEEKGYFKPEINPKGKPYCIILPPPNANAPLHFGHAMYVVEDILIRFKRMQGFKTLWLPGADHAGFETQFVYEQKLQKEGKSRFDFDRETLYKMIWDYVSENRPIMENQLRKLGFSLDWSRSKFTLDPEIIEIVYKTFKKLHEDDLIYRAKRLVNYCTFDGTSFSDLEVIYREKESILYFVKYPVQNGKFITVATTRPETMLADKAVAVNPKDKRYKELIGKTITVPVVNKEIPIIEDLAVDMEFGTGAVKVTPGHDPLDFEIAQRNNITGISIIGFDGKLKKEAGEYKGLYPKQAREKIVEKLKELNLIEKEEKINHSVPTCYKCKNVIEPLLMDQWFVKMKPLAEKGIEAVKKEIKIIPSRFENIYSDFLQNIRDWNISRQTVWGIRIPAYKCKTKNSWFVSLQKPKECEECQNCEFEQDTDTFDTWFSSAQWPFATLMTSNNKEDFDTFYPTDVMETGYDILRWWVARMVMIGIYSTGKAPFKNVVLHGMVNDPLGKKMSKSKGNVVNPLELVEEQGADAVRFALIFGTALGNDQTLSHTKLEAAKKFANKLWNIARFIEMSKAQIKESSTENKNDKQWSGKINKWAGEITEHLDNYRFNLAAERIYEFTWHEFADLYIEDVKTRVNSSSLKTLEENFLVVLKLLHPFMPFITEEIYQKFKIGESIMIEKWPT